MNQKYNTLPIHEKLYQPQYNLYSLDAERGVISGLLIDTKAYESIVSEGLKTDDFYHPTHSIIFSAMEQLQLQYKPINTITVTEQLINMQKLHHIGGAKKIAQLEALLPTSAHIKAYCTIIIEKSILRQLISTATNIIKSASMHKYAANDIINNAEHKILAIRNKKVQNGVYSIKKTIANTMHKILDMKTNPHSSLGILSGFIDFDYLSNGFRPGELIIIASRPSMGKTALALNMASYISMNQNIASAFFSLEMGCEQLTQRLISTESKINLTHLRNGKISQHESLKLELACKKLTNTDLFIDESHTLNIITLREKCRRLIRKNNIKLIFIDYLQLMSSIIKYDNKATEVGEISKGLKTIAREFNIPVIALSQLNRSVESRTDKIPMMSDLRDSGAIEQDADIITFLYRQEYYLRDKTPKDKIGITKIIIAKNRNGPTGSLELKFSNYITKFTNLDKHHN